MTTLGAGNQRRSGSMGLKNKAAVAVTGALTAGAFVTLAGAIPAGAATYGTEQSGAGNVFGIGAHSAIVGSSTHGQNIAFTRSVQGRTVEFKSGRNGCVTGTSGGRLYVETCNGGAAQKFTEASWGPSTALENQATHNYVQDNGPGPPITTGRGRPGWRWGWRRHPASAAGEARHLDGHQPDLRPPGRRGRRHLGQRRLHPDHADQAGGRRNHPVRLRGRGHPLLRLHRDP